MSVRTLKISFFVILFLLAAGTEFAFAQAARSYDRQRGGSSGYSGPVAQPGRPMTQQEAINQRYGAANTHIRETRERWEIEDLERQRAEAEYEAWVRAQQNRPSVARKTDGGIQSPTELNKRLEALRPGDSIELHGDLFTAFDGAILSATYYRGAAGKESVPVVLLHGLGGTRRDFDAIIPALLNAGMAVLVPDIRGHGKSIEYIIEEFGEPDFFDIPFEDIPENPFVDSWLPTRWAGYERLSHDVAEGIYVKPATKITVKRSDKFDERDFALMGYDLQLWQNFLANENNQERLNLKKLNLVGAEMGAGLATFWARNDLAPAQGSAKRQVKTLTIISPVISRDAMEAKKGNGFVMNYLDSNAMRNTLSTMIIVGKNNKRALEDAEAVKKALSRGKTDNETGLKAAYPLIQCNTEKQGRDLFSLTSAKIDQGIPAFIKDRLTKLEVAAAEKKNDKTLIWTGGTWNAKK